ncbi:MAG: hypothetical protein Q9165_003947 [Trypethelium subeluteriae]
MTKPRVKNGLMPFDNLNQQSRQGLRNPAHWSGRPGDSSDFISASKTPLVSHERSAKRRKVNNGSEQRSQVGLEDELAEATQYERTTHRQSPTQSHGIVQEYPSTGGHAAPRKDSTSTATVFATWFNTQEFDRTNELLQVRQDSRHRKPREPRESREPQDRHPFVDLRPKEDTQEVPKQIDLTMDDSISPANRHDSTASDQRIENRARQQNKETRLRPIPVAQQFAKAQQHRDRREHSSQSSTDNELNIIAGHKQVLPPRESDFPNGNTRDKFKRVSPDDSDLDELHGSTTVGLHSKRASENRDPNGNALPPSPDTEQGNPSFSSVDDALSANIEPTRFSNSGPRKSIQASSIAKAKRRRGEKQSAWPIDTFWSSEFDGISSSDLLLCHDHSSNDFYVSVEKEPIQQDGTTFPLVKHSKIRKVVISQEGQSLSIEGPRIGNVDYIVDITFTNHDDVEEFVGVLRSIAKDTLPILMKSSWVHLLETCKTVTDEAIPRRDYFRGLFLNHQRNKAMTPYHPNEDGADAERIDIHTPSQGHSSKQGNTQQEALVKQAPKKRRIAESLQQDIKYDEHDELQNHDTMQKSSTQPKIVYETSDPQGATLIEGRERRREGLRNSTRQAAPGKYRTFDPPDEVLESERFSKKYGLGETWDQSVIYPEIGARRSTVDFHDLKRLDDGEFLNDNLIAFYLRYCEEAFQEKQMSEKPKVHFFSNFFFSALSTADNGHRGFNYKAVQRWTSKVDIFGFDYIVVPINEDLHWYVAIICNLPNLARKLVRANSEEPKEEKLVDAVFGKLESHLDAAQEARRSASLSPRIANIGEGQSSNVVSSLEADLNKLSTRSPPEKEIGQDPNADTKSAIAQPTQESEGALTGRTHLTKEGDGSSSGKIEAQAEEQPLHGGSTASEKKSRRKSGPVRKSNTHEPAIIMLDSLGGDRLPASTMLKKYLIAEGKSRRSMDINSKDIQGINAKHIPTQGGYCDCGLYLLGYVSRFLEEPQDFVRKIMSKQPVDFPELNPSSMRAHIRNLLQDLHKEQKKARDQKLEAKGKGKNIRRQAAQKEKMREGGQQDAGETQSQLLHQKPLETVVASVPSGQEPKDEVTNRSPSVQVGRSMSPSKPAVPLVSQPTRSSGSPVKATGVLDAEPLSSKNASSRQDPKPVIISESQCLLHESQQPESLEDSVVFVSEQAVPKEASPPQPQEEIQPKRAGDATTSRKRLISNLPRTRDDGDSPGRYHQGLDIITQLREAGEDGDPLGRYHQGQDLMTQLRDAAEHADCSKPKRKQRGKMRETTQVPTLEEAQEVAQEGKEEDGQGGGQGKNRRIERRSEENEVEVIPESPVG